MFENPDATVVSLVAGRLALDTSASGDRRFDVEQFSNTAGTVVSGIRPARNP